MYEWGDSITSNITQLAFEVLSDFKDQFPTLHPLNVILHGRQETKRIDLGREYSLETQSFLFSNRKWEEKWYKEILCWREWRKELMPYDVKLTFPAEWQEASLYCECKVCWCNLRMHPLCCKELVFVLVCKCFKQYPRVNLSHRTFISLFPCIVLRL